ncbi:heparinase II/III domain-containing protein [Desertihabitans aurantiacus]|uniref:heparinase II/III domain-containing protein n=1 Tax=Desertihabitans aurantiacus TaxID=2282477 RepID=UPI000DF72867|nr:heparinase II/III family protein [Desertihabitans aurantiacus]
MSTFLRPRGTTLDGRDRDPAYAAAWRTVESAARASLASPLRGRDVTDRPAGWGHNYYCPVHSGALRFEETQPDRHHCEEFDHDVAGEQFDTGWAYARNVRLLEHLDASALAAAVTGRRQHVERAVGVLTELAEVYPGLPLHGEKVGRAKLMHQSLEEAVAATSLARSHALVERWMTPQQRELVAERLLRPMVAVIEQHLMNRTHNIEVWHLAGLASLAVALDDRELASSTLTREHGFESQLADGVRADGWWYEGSPGYHFYMLTAVLNAVESYRALELGADVATVLEQMLLTPLRVARNDLTVPSTNDSHLATAEPPGLAVHADLYVRGAALCRSEELDRFLASSQADALDRATAAYLVHGRPSVEREAPRADGWPVPRVDVQADSGYAVLRQPTAQRGSGPDTCAFIKFGPHGGGHGHPDKLEIELVVEGSRVIADPATTMYTNPIHRPWYVQTWSHSTVLVDRISQPPTRGRLLGHRQVAPGSFGCVDTMVAFGEEPDPEGVGVLWHIDDPAPVAAYAGVTIRRVLTMLPPELGDYLLDLVLVDSPHPHAIDLITHVRGRLDSPAGRAATDRVLLPEFRDVRLAAEPTGRTDYRLTDDGRPWSRWHTGADELLTADTPSNPTSQRCASTVERVVGRSALFAAVLPLGQARVTGVRTTAPSTVEVVLGERTHRWHLAPQLRADPAAGTWTEPPLVLEVDA